MKDENFYLCWSDFSKALSRHRQVIGKAAFFCAGIFLFFALLCTPVFKGEALFHVKSQKSLAASDLGGMFQLAAGSSGSKSELALTLTVLESRSIGERVIERTGLQITPRPAGRSLRLIRNVKDNLLSEFAWWADRPSGATKARNHAWSFSNVVYKGLYKRPFMITFNGDGGFELSYSGSKFSGKLGELFCSDDLSFVLEGDAEALANKRLEFIAEPMFKTFARYKRRLHAKMSKRKNNVLIINYLHSSPTVSMRVTNALMGEYLRAVKMDAKRITDEQLQFLAHAQQGSYKELTGHFDEYLNFVEKRVSQGGYLKTKDALEMLGKNYGLTQQKLGELEREAAMLAQAKPILVSSSHKPLQAQLSQYSAQLHDLNARKNSLELALEKSSSLKGQVVYHLQAQEKERQYGLYLDKCLINSSDSTYYRSLLASSHLRRRIHEAKMVAAAEPPSEIQGLGLNAATVNYQSQLDALSELRKQGAALDHALDRISSEDFDTGALIDTLAVGSDFQKKVAECHTLSLALKEKKNYSVKENMRLTQELQEKRAALQEHLANVRAVNATQQVQVKEWIQKAQVGLLGLICKEIALLEEEVRRTVEQRRVDLESEIRSHKLSLDNMKKQMAEIPKAWLQEKKLDMQTDFQSQVMQALARLVESRQISAALDIVESKPLDAAVFPIRPNPPHLVLFTVVGSLVGLVCGALYALVRAALQGFPASYDNLRVRGQFVAGRGDAEKERALFYTRQNILFCTGLDREEFLRLVELAKLQGENVKTAARSSQFNDPDIKLRRLCASEIEAAAAGLDRLFVYVSRSPLSPETLAALGFKGDWIVHLKQEKIRELTPYFAASEQARVAFLFSSSR